MNRFFSLVMALTMCVALTTPAWADSYEKDAQGRHYRVCSDGRYTGFKFLELTEPDYADPVAGMTFCISSVLNRGYNLDVNNAASTSGTMIHVYNRSDDQPAQQFKLFDEGDGYFSIRPAYNTKYAVDGGGSQIKNSDTEYGYTVHLWEVENGVTNDAQKWKFERFSDGSYIIHCKKEDKVLDISGGTINTSKSMQTWTRNASVAQRWILRPVFDGKVLTRAIPDTYFQNYLVRNFPVYKYDWVNRVLVGGDNPQRATPSSSNTSYPTCGANERLVMLASDYAAAITEFNNLGKYGNISYKDQSTGTKQFEGASNFKGVEYFTKLKKLDLSHAQFGDSIGTASTDPNKVVPGYHGNYTKITPASLNLQYNTELEYLNLDYADFKSSSDLQSSHIYDLKKLTFLNLSNNYLEDIDLDQFPVLERFQACHNYDLRTIIADSENEHMKELAIFDSMIGYDGGTSDNSSLQNLVNKFPNLVFLHAFATPNYELDLTGNTKLQSIWLLKSAYGASQGLVYDGIYNIVSYKDPKLGLDCANSGTGGGTNVGLFTLDKSKANQKFKIVYRKTENNLRWYSILPSYATTMSLDVAGGSSADGTNIQLWGDDQDNSKLFAFVRNNDGTYKIVSKLNSSSVLDIKDGNIASGTNIQLYHDNGSDAQKWVLLPVDLTITTGQAGSARQIAKGPWLHKLDLSKCEELRDVNVQNMHLASLNLNSEYIKKPLSDEYKDWTFCREVTNADGVYGAGQLVPDVIVKNNYRHVNVNTFKHKDEKTGKWCWMFYLRLSYNGNDAKEESLVLNKQTSYFETMTLDTYNNCQTLGSMSRKEFKIESTLEEDSLNCDRISYFYNAKEIDNINSTGLMTHDLSVVNDHTMCTIEHDGVNPPIVNNGEVQDAATSQFLEHFSKKVYGKILLLKAGVSDNEPTTVPDNVPKAVYYAYDMNTRHHTQKYAPARKGVSAKEEGEQSVMGGFYFDLHYPVTFQDPHIVTAIDEVNVENKEVASVKYYNLAGIENDNPFVGVNIMVVTYTDGTKSTAKVLK